MNIQAAVPAKPFANAHAAGLASFHDASAVLATASAGRLIRIEAAHEHRAAANALLRQRYSWRGYDAVSLPAPGVGHCLPLTATRDGEVIGTLTVNFDSDRGLNCDDTFPEELTALRARGERLCEFTKLAVETDSASAQVLAALFHVAFLAARHLERVDLLLLEVNPRHVRYYQRMLGACVIAQTRMNRRVSAPAVLLAMATDDVRKWIDKRCAAFAPEAANDEQATGDAGITPSARTLYGRAFSRTEEAAILTRLSRQWPPASAFAFRLPSARASEPVPA